MTIGRRRLLYAGAIFSAGAVAGCIGSPIRDTDGLPVTGHNDASVVGLDDIVLEFMRTNGIRAGVTGVLEGDEITAQRGYGWENPAESVAIDPEVRFRVGSISKSFTDAVIEQLRDRGPLSSDDSMINRVSVDLPPTAPADSRFRSITIEHLREHSAGWNRYLAGDPLYRLYDVAESLGLDGLPTSADVLRYVATQPLQFDPGTRRVYSNVGYLCLGRVIEGVTGRKYGEYVDESLMEPLDVDSITLGRTLPAERPNDEIWYDDGGTCTDVFAGDFDIEGPCADAGFSLRTFDSAGGYIASTRGLLQFLDMYWLTGHRRDEGEPPANNDRFLSIGTHPGSFALAWQSAGLCVVVMLNGRPGPTEGFPSIVREFDSLLQGD